MILFDVNVLVYSHREEMEDHPQYRAYLEGQLSGAAPFGVSASVLSGFIRVVTHPEVFRTPTPLLRAIEFADTIRSRTNCVTLNPGAGHWDIFVRLCQETSATGNTVPDAYHAALAIETGSEWITTDRGFGRFRGLRWSHPLA